MVLHALFGNEQDGCCNHQAAANNIEDGSADAAGAGQGSAAVVLDGYQMVSAGCCICLTVLDGLTAKCSGFGGIFGQGTLDDDFNGGGQSVVTLGSVSLFQIVSTSVQTLKLDVAVSGGLDLCGGFLCVASPAGQLVNAGVSAGFGELLRTACFSPSFLYSWNSAFFQRGCPHC